MEINTDAPTIWHTVVPTSMGALTLVRDAEALRGLYYPHHWYLPNPLRFGPRRADGFDDVIRQLREYLDGQRREFDLSLDPRGDKLQQRVWTQVQRIAYGQHHDVRRPGQASRRRRDAAAGRGGGGP